MEENKTYNENCLETMSRIPDNFIDLTVTSPPYDDLRTYNGYSFDFESVAKELYRVTKDGGVLVWIVGDATVKGSETGTSFKQALYFKDVGFNLHDTMIWRKKGSPPNDKRQNRYINEFEYMFILSKGKPKTCNYIMIDSIFGGKTTKGKQCEKDGTQRKKGIVKRIVGIKKPLSNVWDISKVNRTTQHPAMFPEKLAEDHILSWSNECDLIYDPFHGSGTTGKMALKNNRRFMGSEISEAYTEICNQRTNIKGDLFSIAV